MADPNLTPETAALLKSLAANAEKLGPAHNSVLDPWYVKAGREVSGALGLDNINTLVGMFSPGSLGVTTFLKNGVPDVAARTKATGNAVSSLISALKQSNQSPQVIENVVKSAERHPRVLAHTEFYKDNGYLPRRVAGQNQADLSKGYKQSKIVLNLQEPFSLSPPQQFQQSADVANVVNHELAHAAQRISHR
jgi:hypothetical protein